MFYIAKKNNLLIGIKMAEIENAQGGERNIRNPDGRREVEKSVTYRNRFELAIKVMYGEFFGLPLMQLYARTVEDCEIEELANAIELLESFHGFCAKKVADALREIYYKGLIMTASFGREDSPVLYVFLPYWTFQSKKKFSGKDRKFTPQEKRVMMMQISEILLETEPDEITPYNEGIRAWWTWWND